MTRKANYSSDRREEREKISQVGDLKLDTSFFKGLIEDTRYVLTSPWRWDNSDWTAASIVLGVTGGLFLLDDRIQNVVEDNRNSTTDDLSNFFEHFGNAFISLPALTGLYLYGRLGENYKMERTALLATESFLVTSLFTTVIKAGIGRARPDTTDSSSSTFSGPFSSNNSFPSGHTSTAFAIATVVAHEYEENPMMAPISYGIASLTGLSRINDDQHWASDIFLGAALGYFTSKTILKLHSNRKGRHFSIYPRADHLGGGLVLSSRF
ncbi:MAG: phosphatase PAP2 family protein [Nitrospina sp.]|nr:phosphatase PAP2 family protein [Nitrospina sp.]